jgi:hypothetical protein
MSKTKATNIVVIDRKQDPDLYALMDQLIEAHHADLRTAKIALAWRFGWKPDPDGRLQLGQFRKAADLDRQLHGYDAAILLNFEAWGAAEFGKEHQAALLDHELCHGALAMDENGEAKQDEDGRMVYRVRKHDVEEFVCIIERHGIWKRDLQAFAEAALEAQDHPLLGLKEAVEKLRPKKGSGLESITLESGGKSVTLEAH